ncbi:MAG: hypothetical protein RI907_1575 [Pseudomonadota bacterium]|jgi:sigma-E factor negative regulatory protein RseA
MSFANLESSMSDRNVSASEALSALADGEASASEVARACGAWRNDPELRARWHEYHLIGDAMRSPELAAPSSSAAFLQNFRERLAQEPVVLAPASAAAAARPAAAAPVRALRPLQKRTWTGPIAVAASFVAVVAALLGNQVAPSSSSGVLLGAATPVDSGLSAGLVAPHVVSLAEAEPSFNRPVQGAPELVRDPRVEQALGNAPLGHTPAELTFTNAGALARQASYDLR